MEGLGGGQSSSSSSKSGNDFGSDYYNIVPATAPAQGNVSAPGWLIYAGLGLLALVLIRR